MNRRWFGTDGIRGEFGKEPMTPAFALRCGRAAAVFFRRPGMLPLFVIGRDTRASGPVLEEAFCRGLREEGAEVRRVGVLPTAAVSLITRKLKAEAGVMISASHNPFTDNGIKFFGPEGFKLDDTAEMELEKRIEATPGEPWEGGVTGDYGADGELRGIYEAALRASLDSTFSLSGRKLLVDGAHGAAWDTTPSILRSLGAEVEPIGVTPDGKNINEGCGSLYPDLLAERIRQSPGAIGICHDGDADRLIMVDEDGVSLDGDEVLAIVAVARLKHGVLPGNGIAATVMSNLGLDEALRAAGGRVVRASVGDRYVFEAMRNEGFVLGGEQSGHLLFLEHLPTGDGLLAALQVLQVVVKSGKPLKELRQVMRKYPQRLINEKVHEKKPFSELPEVQSAVSEVEKEMGGKGRVLLRYSGTENKVRLLLEYAEAGPMDAWAERIMSPLRRAVGV